MGVIRSTHAGSLIRPPELLAFLAARDGGKAYDEAAFEQTLRTGVLDIVKRQADAGIDIVGDGELAKASWITYLYERLEGVEARPASGDTSSFFKTSRDRRAFPGFYAHHDAELMRELAESDVADESLLPGVWTCTGPITYDRAGVDRDIANLKAAIESVDVSDAFLAVVAPASTSWLENDYYGTEEEFIYALADALAIEYKAIVDAGFLLQVDDAVLMSELDTMLAEGVSIDDYRRWAQLRIDALNHALDGLPSDRIRYHICWGSWHGPHVHDAPLAEIVDMLLQVNAGAYSLEQANARHEHEWSLWEDVELPEDKILIPGVVTHHTTVVEHPDLVAQRLVRLAKVVGPERVQAGTDCGFAQGAFVQRVHPEIQWAKLEALTEGARRASEQLSRA